MAQEWGWKQMPGPLSQEMTALLDKSGAGKLATPLPDAQHPENTYLLLHFESIC